MTTSYAYEVRELGPQDDAEVLAVLTGSLAEGPTGRRSAEYLHWKHRDSPFGASPGLAATVEGRIVAVRLLMRWELEVEGQPVPAVRAVDTATAPEHRGRGLFRRLTLEALSGVAADAALVFNTPNTQSRAGYLKMGWQVVGDVPLWVAPVHPVRLLRSARRSGQQAVHGPQAPVASALPVAADVLRDRATEVQRLLSEAARGADPRRLRTRRHLPYLCWRYAPPGLDYRAVVVEQDGELRGLGIGRLRRRGPLAELTLAEVLTAPGDRAAARAVLRGAARSGADHVLAHLSPGSAQADVATRAGYLRVPRRGLTLTVNPRRPLPVDAQRLTSWDLQLGDLELF